MRKKIVAGNWKMNKTAQEAFVLATEVAELVKSSVSADVQVIMSTPALYLTGVNQVSIFARSAKKRGRSGVKVKLPQAPIAALTATTVCFSGKVVRR